MANLEKQVKALHAGPVLPSLLQPRLQAWVEGGYEGVTMVTLALLQHWFHTEHEEAAFHPAQRTAIETAVFVHEVLGRELPQGGGFLHALHTHLDAPEDRDALFAPWWTDPLPRYGFKLATGTGKTWVLQALLVWQVLNRLAVEQGWHRGLPPEEAAWRRAAFSARCLVVTPGLVVHGRLLDALLGLEDDRGNRHLDKADLRRFRELFIPSDYRDAFFGAFRPLDGRSVLETTPQPDAFALVVNWQALMDRSGDEDEVEHPAELLTTPKYGSVTVRGDPRYLVLRDWLAAAPDLVIYSDEAHHTHTNAGGEEGAWEEALSAIRTEQREHHGAAEGFRGDFSATPFFQMSAGRGKAKQPVRKWFPHILCDYGLAQAQKDMLVKQLWIVKDPRLPEGEIPRSEEGQLTETQKALLEVGLAKRKWVEDGFTVLGVEGVPKLLVVAEDTAIADRVVDYLEQERVGDFGLTSGGTAVLHSGRKGALKPEEYEALRRRIFAADRRDDLQVIVNVSMLQEGFDVNSICVIVFLRAGQSSILVEQVIGRGLRLMFRKESVEPDLWAAKVEALTNLKARKEPLNAFDMLYLVDHPRFRTLLRETLEADGLDLGEGEVDESRTAAGELLTVEVAAGRVPGFDLAWPLGFVREDPPLPDVRDLLKHTFKPVGDQNALELLRRNQGVMLSKEHVESGTQVGFVVQLSSDAQVALAKMAEQLVAGRSRGQSWLSAQWAEMLEVVERVAEKHLFPRTDFDPLHRDDDARVLRSNEVTAHLKKQLEDARDHWLAEVQRAHPSDIGVSGWGWASQPELDGRGPVLRGRVSRRIEGARCVFPAIFETPQGGGLERDFVEKVLETSGEIQAWFKPLERRHSLFLHYRTRFGELSRYWPDFLVGTPEALWLIETKSARDRELPSIWDKARAALEWCRTASQVLPPAGHPDGSAWTQPATWRYAILFEDQWNREATAFTPLVAQAEAFTLAFLRAHGDVGAGSLLEQMQRG
jgi:type III restriction enzyme